MRHPFAVAAVLSCLSIEPGAAAEPLGMQGDALKAFQAFDEATERLKNARTAMMAVESGGKPPSTSSDWDGVIASYQAAAEMIRRSSGPAGFDASAYGVPLEELKSCATRPSALARLDKQLKGLHAAGQRGSETRALLKSRLDAAHAADETRRYLVSTAAKLGGAPELAELFPWSWQELETSVSRSISAHVSEVKRQQERLDRGQAELKSSEANLASQVESFGRAKDCLLVGSWTGSKSQAGMKAGVALVLTSSGTSWGGTANLGGAPVAVRSVSIAGSNVSISFADGKASMKGTLSADGRSYQGWLSSNEGPGSFALQKQ